MTVNDTALSLCQQALADIGTRSKITDLPSPFGTGTDASQESYFCGLYFSTVRDHLLRAARWNFAKRTEQLFLWKAAPGTQENPTPLAARTAWNAAYPAPPWLYSYQYPGPCLYVQRVIGPSPMTNVTPPIFSGTTNLLTAFPRVPYSKFEFATDIYDASNNLYNATNQAVTVAVSATGSSYTLGDVISLVNAQYPVTAVSWAGAPQAVNLIVTSVNTSGGVTGVKIASNGSYITPTPANPISIAGTTGLGTGATFNVTWQLSNILVPSLAATRVILTNVQNCIAEYTRIDTIPFEWDSLFSIAFKAAMAGTLAQPLTGDKALARDKIVIANNFIMEARTADANEALTINDHTPDWLRVRGIGGGLGFEDDYFAPYGPLFPSPPPF